MLSTEQTPVDMAAPSFNKHLWGAALTMTVEQKSAYILDSWPTFGVIDLAPGFAIRRGFTSIKTIAYCPDDKSLHLKDVVQKGFKFHEIVELVPGFFAEQAWQYALMENNSFQTAVVDTLHARYPDLNIYSATAPSSHFA